MRFEMDIKMDVHKITLNDLADAMKQPIYLYSQTVKGRKKSLCFLPSSLKYRVVSDGERLLTSDPILAMEEYNKLDISKEKEA